MRPVCECSTPFGLPVVPDVYSTRACPASAPTSAGLVLVLVLVLLLLLMLVLSVLNMLTPRCSNASKL